MVTLWNTLLQTVSQMPSVTLQHGGCNKWPNKQPTDANLRVGPCVSAPCKGGKSEVKGQGRDKKGQGDRTVQKMFAESILNTVVEVTIYLMPAKLARTSGAGYLVQLFMISSKI